METGTPTSNVTSPYSEMDEKYFIVGGLTCFCISFCTLLNFRNLKRDPILPILLNLCIANALKSSAYYVSGIKTLFFRYYRVATPESFGYSFGEWTCVWLFLGNQAVSWATLALAFDRFVSVAYPAQYSGTRSLYKALVVTGSWLATVITWLAAQLGSNSNLGNLWRKIDFVKNGATSLIGFFRCLDAAAAISCFIFLLYAVIVNAKFINASRKKKSRWIMKLRTPAGPQRKNGVVASPSRHIIYLDETQSDSSSIWVLVPNLISLHFNGTLWLFPSIVSFIRTASADTLNFHSTTIFIISVFRLWHGSIDILVHTLKSSDVVRKLFRCFRGRKRPFVTLASRTGSNTASVTTTHGYQACSSTAGTTSYVYLDHMTIGDGGASYT